MDTSKIFFRPPKLEDGANIYKLIQSCPPLDINSQYYYYIICHDFAQSCVIAEANKQIIGFISAYLKPKNPNCLFVWQVAVTPQTRGRNLATSMLTWLTKQPKCNHIESLETTISPSNQASQRLFQRFSQSNNAVCETLPFLDEFHFAVNKHEEEILYRISPLKIKKN